MFQTPFERNILPRFSRWLAEILQEVRPDVIVPVERKGAHLLDAALDYLRAELALPVRAQILNRRAVYFTEPTDWNGRTALLLDDTVHSGRTLNAYKDALKANGNPVVRMIACVGAPLQEADANRRAQDAIRCFLEPPQKQYQEYVWQVAEHIISRGMPPEVDHHIFRLSSSLPLQAFWSSLIEILGSHGHLDIYEPSLDGIVRAATLHWPTFMEGAALPLEGPIRKEGVVKLRLFADSRRGHVWLLPMAYPRIEMHMNGSGKDLDLCQEALDSTDIPQALLASRVLSEAVAPHAQGAVAAEVLFHAVSLSCETEVVRRFKQALHPNSRELGDPIFSCDEAVFVRLYGNRAGARISSAVDRAIEEEAVRKSKTIAVTSGGPRSTDLAHEMTSVDATTDSIARTLKSRYLQGNRGKSDRRDWDTVGLSFSELIALEPLAKVDNRNLLLSRCIDYGCAITTLVPFVRVAGDGNIGSWTVDRSYRTSESMSDIPDRTEDTKSYLQEVASETVAAVAHFLARRSARWNVKSGKRPPLLVVEKVLAILHGTLGDENDSALVVIPQEHGPEIAFQFGNIAGPTQQVLIRNMRTEHYAVQDDGVEVTPAFVAAYEGGTLRLHLRKSLPGLEASLGALVPILDEASDVTALLKNWGSASGGKLGLDFAMYDVDKALSALLVPINVLASGRPIISGNLERSTRSARQFIGVAIHEKIEAFQKQWGGSVRERWPSPIEVERRLVESVLEPAEKDGIYPLARAFCRAISRFTDLVDRFAVFDVGDHMQKDMFSAPADERASARSLLEDVDRLFVVLRTMRSITPSLPHLPADPQDIRMHLGHVFKAAYDALRQFARALACDYEERRNLPGVRPASAPRFRTVIAADLKDSTIAGLTLSPAEYSKWGDNGIEILTQWGHALGGSRIGDARGDEVVMEFRDGDSALICAGLVQEHLRALRSVGAGGYRYISRIALDSYELHPGSADNVKSSALNRASKLVKFEKVEDNAAGIADRIWLTPEAVEQMSDAARSHVLRHPRQIDLGADVKGACFAPFTPDLAAFLQAYLGRLKAYGEEKHASSK